LIQVGQVLDKYELLERVGQGGMAIVYRGIDRTLKRTVAVKILHKHLSDYQEARDRFEREAQAVAKLRHENILEIFDYSAKEGSESYIVTEFIDGQTLKQFITDRPITFPEIGAMIILQVCRALAHAHAGSILHRDVKPENIMIRHDGVVKLMDFGISHMVDLERLTVTGQLLGSPAYMAPEHVEGRPLDFRTDVFAAGIVLYQLTVGKLPFEGKNPHEVLKRIAECRFLDPRQANPRIGNRLGRIILKAMAAAPDDRYAAVGEMVLALEAYLEESGLAPDKIPAELARYFQAPASYEAALKARLVDILTRTGKQKLDGDDRAGALDVFDRVLTIDPENAVVLALLDKLNRRARLQTVLIATLGVLVLAFGGYMIHEKSKREPAGVATIDPKLGSALGPDVRVTHETLPDAPQPDAAQVAMAKPDAAPLVVRPLVDAQPMATKDAEVVVQPTIDAAPSAVDVQVSVTVAGSEYKVEGQKWKPLDGKTFTVKVDREVTVTIRNPYCQEVDVKLDGKLPSVAVAQHFISAALRVKCNVKDVSVTIDGAVWKLDTETHDQDKQIPFADTAISHDKQVMVEFIGHAVTDPHSVTVTAGKLTEVTCDLH
jgi:eukaryotic-like serine/threonine-protein kinase